DDLTTHPSGEEVTVAGLNSILPKEHGNKFYELQILHHHDKDVSAVASWDSSIHDSQYLNRITEANERVYLILKTTVRLSHPAPMDLILRKRLGLNIYKRQSFTDRIRKKIVRADQLTQTGVTYEVVSNIPKASEELEEREKKYTRGVSAVESILTLDRLRQSVAVKELEQARGQPITMRKTASVPNFSQVPCPRSVIPKVDDRSRTERFKCGVSRWVNLANLCVVATRPQLSQALENAAKNGSNIMRLDSSFESLAGLASVRSGSVADLADDTPRRPLHRHSYAAPAHNDPEIVTPTKPFGLASPASGKIGLRMTTLHEEPGRRNDDDSHSEPESAPTDDMSTPRSNRTRSRGTARGFLPTSKTLDSLHELACERVPNKNSPSISSSGYDFDKAMDYTHITRTKHSMAGLRNEITELRNDINDLKNEIVESKNELDDTTYEKTKTPITPGAKRINPFLRDCEEVSKGTEQLVDPLGAIPIESVMTVSSQSNKSEIHHVNGDSSHEGYIGDVDGESVSSEHSSHSAERSREASSLRLSSSTGVVAYVGPTHFAHGLWVGVELDAPT
ncbi:Kinesin-like protein KIF13A, partial [Operophtera brumata]